MGAESCQQAIKGYPSPKDQDLSIGKQANEWLAAQLAETVRSDDEESNSQEEALKTTSAEESESDELTES
jgi:hypothetical protein